MRVYARPQFWWRIAVVSAGALGLLTGTHRIVFYTCQSNIIVLGYYLGVLYWMVRRRTVAPSSPPHHGCAARSP